MMGGGMGGVIRGVSTHPCASTPNSRALVGPGPSPLLSPASPPLCSTVCTHPRLIVSRHTSVPADFVHIACAITLAHACVDVRPLGGVQPPQHTFLPHSAALTAASPSSADFRALHACIHRNTHVWTPVHLVGYSPHDTRVFAAPCRFVCTCDLP